MPTASSSVMIACGLVGLALVGCRPEYDIGAPVDINPEDVLECPFTHIDGTPLSAYDCNPVFSGTEEEWGDGFTSVGFRTQNILGHPFYQIWYSANPDGVVNGEYGLGYAISGDGIHWETHAANPLVEEDGGWDRDRMDAIQVVWDAGRNEYVMAYQGFNLDTNRWGLGSYTSPDGIDWTAFNDGQPILDLTVPVAGVNYCWPLGFTHSESSGFAGYLAGNPGTANVCQVYGFTGDSLDDGFSFGGDPVLRAGPEPYDAAGMVSAAVVELQGTWYMFYVGYEAWTQGQGYQLSRAHSLNLATSDDGVTWTKDPDNPLPVDRSELQLITGVAAQVVGSRIHLWVTDYYEELDQSAVGYFLYEP